MRKAVLSNPTTISWRRGARVESRRRDVGLTLSTGVKAPWHLSSGYESFRQRTVKADG